MSYEFVNIFRHVRFLEYITQLYTWTTKNSFLFCTFWQCLMKLLCQFPQLLYLTYMTLQCSATGYSKLRGTFGKVPSSFHFHIVF